MQKKDEVLFKKNERQLEDEMLQKDELNVFNGEKFKGKKTPNGEPIFEEIYMEEG